MGDTFVVEQKLYLCVCNQHWFSSSLLSGTLTRARVSNELELASARPHQADDRQDGDRDRSFILPEDNNR
jgi:hypothetical protein